MQWGLGLEEPQCNQHPSGGASGCNLDTFALGYPLPFLATKPITTNFKARAEAGLTLASQRGCQFQAQQKRLLCIQGMQPVAESQYHDLLRRVRGIGPAQMGEAHFPSNGSSLPSEGQGRG